MAQKSLFGNLPQLDKQSKELNKKIAKKANSPKAKKTKTVRKTSGKDSKSKLKEKIASIVALAKESFEGQEDLYLCIRTEEELSEYIDKIKENGYASLDVESTGLNILGDDYLVGTVLHTDGKKSCYIPHKHTDLDGNVLPDQLSYETMTEYLKPILDIDWYFHNADFDIRTTNRWLDLPDYLHVGWDTMLGGHYLNENENHGLKYLWNKYINTDSTKEADKFSELFSDVPFNYIPIEIAYLYAAKDGLMTTQLTKFQQQFLDPKRESCEEKGLKEAGTFFVNVELPLIRVIASMEDRGVGIDKEVSDKLYKEYTAKLEEANENLQQVVRNLDTSKLDQTAKNTIMGGVNYNSAKQMQTLLYDVLKIKSVDRKSPRGTGAGILEKIKELHPEHGQLVDSVLECRGLKKLLSTYVEKLPRVVNERTGKLHGSFNQYGAVTGRFSSKDPNLQNIPSKNKEIRKMFIPTDGYYLIGGDFS